MELFAKARVWDLGYALAVNAAHTGAIVSGFGP
jgi:hypothetical protein